MIVNIEEITNPIENYESQTVFEFIDAFCKSDGTIKTIDDNFKAIKAAFTNLNLTSSNIEFDSGIVPKIFEANYQSKYTLGNEDKPWGNIYLGGNIIPKAPIDFGNSSSLISSIYGSDIYGKRVHIENLYGYNSPVWVYADLVPSDLAYNLGGGANRWKDAYINRIYTDSLYINNKEFDPEIYGDGFVHDNWTINFGTEGNYKNEPFMSTLVVNQDYADNGTNNTQFKKNSQIKVNVTKGGYITLVGYPGYSNYTIQINGTPPIITTGTYSTTIATTDQEIVITSKDEHTYYISLTIHNYRQITLTDAVKRIDTEVDQINQMFSKKDGSDTIIAHDSIAPISDETYDLGSDDFKWENTYTKCVYTSYLYCLENHITIEDDLIPSKDDWNELGSSSKAWSDIYTYSLTMYGDIDMGEHDIRQVKTLGGVYQETPWDNAYDGIYFDSHLFSGGYDVTAGHLYKYDSNTETRTEPLYPNGNITPSKDNTYSLGTSSKRFKKLYIAGESTFGGTMHAGDIKIDPNKGIRQGYKEASGDVTYVRYVTERDLLHQKITNLEVTGSSSFGERTTFSGTIDAQDILAQSLRAEGTVGATQMMIDHYIKIRNNLIIDEEPETEDSIGGMRIETSRPLHIRGDEIFINDKKVKYVISDYTIDTTNDEIRLTLEEV